MTSVEILIAKLEKVAADLKQPQKIRDAAHRDAQGYKAAWAKKLASK